MARMHLPHLMLLITSLAVFSSSVACQAETTKLVSVVDYMKSVKVDSSFNNRKKFFSEKWPSEGYRGKAEQNLKLLKHLLSNRKQMLLPFPSSSIESCSKFYDQPELTIFLTTAFKMNAVKACVVTGTQTPQNKIRIKLQELYRITNPADGKTFTATEHKIIHDAAYKAAGCKEQEAAGLFGWYVVDTVALPSETIDWTIKKFGPCTITGEELK